MLLFFIVFVVETLSADGAWESLLANLNLHLGVESRTAAVDESHADALIGGDGVIARRHLANDLSVFQYAVSMTGNGLVVQLDAYQFLVGTFRLLLCQGFLADKLFLIQFHEHRQARHDRRDVCRQLVTVEWKSDLEA